MKHNNPGTPIMQNPVTKDILEPKENLLKIKVKIPLSEKFLKNCDLQSLEMIYKNMASNQKRKSREYTIEECVLVVCEIYCRIYEDKSALWNN